MLIEEFSSAVTFNNGDRHCVNPEEIAASIESELQNSIITEIPAKDIGEMVLRRLKEIDIVSYIRFASVYREFKDVDSFMNEISSLSEKEKVGKKK
jgi:transcriptional regulator NrdR family protein